MAMRGDREKQQGSVRRWDRNSILDRTAQYSVVYSRTDQYGAHHSTMQYMTAQYSAAQNSTWQYRAVQYTTVTYSTAHHSAINCVTYCTSRRNHLGQHKALHGSLISSSERCYTASEPAGNDLAWNMLPPKTFGTNGDHYYVYLYSDTYRMLSPRSL